MPQLLLDIPPYILTLGAAILFSLSNHLQSAGLSRVSVSYGSTIMIVASALVHWAMAPFFFNPERLGAPETLYFIVVGLFLPAISMSLALAGVRYLGATLQSSLSSTGPIFAAIIGVAFLGEHLSWQMMVGIAGITAAVLLQQSRRQSPSLNWPRWAIMLPLTAVLFRILGQAITKIGLNNLPDPFYASTISTTMSALVLIGLNMPQWRSTERFTLQPGMLWFVAAGATLGVGFILLNISLFTGSLIGNVLILSTSPVFSIAWSVFVFKKEVIDARFLLAIAMVAASVFLVVSR